MKTQRERNLERQLYGVREAAHVLRVSPFTLRKWARERRLPVIRLGRRAVRFDPAALDRLIARSTTDERD